MKILLVDDDVVDRTFIKRTLKKSDLNATVTEAVTVDEGLAYNSKQEFDIILLDYRMPQRDGVEMLVEVRNESRNYGTAIVMMSASEDEDLALQCIAAGAQDFLKKSEITSERLRRAVLHAAARYEIEKQLNETYRKVKQLAETDALTGLSNRYLFEEALKQAIANNQRHKHRLALLLFDLDNFKLINDNFGHDVGDLLLTKVVHRIKGCLRGNEVFARLGGDEFVILLTNLDSVDSASLVARRILNVLKKPIEIASTQINISASIGIAIHPDNGCRGEELFKFADIAMYRAKKLGKNQLCFFEVDMQKHYQNRLSIETQLMGAVERREFELHYQPIVEPSSNEVKGVEALIRWKYGEGVLGPDKFISIAEETKQIIPIGLWVIETAFSSLAQWNARYSKSLSMAVNVSPVQLSDPRLVNHIAKAIEANGLDASLIHLEITETALFETTSETDQNLIALNELGVKLSLDDFGTGYSSIAHLKDFPISIVKIDRSLMPGLHTKNESLVAAVVSMAKVLGLEVVAEGVELQEQLDLCKKLDVESVQGYFYSKPIPGVKFEEEYLL